MNKRNKSKISSLVSPLKLNEVFASCSEAQFRFKSTQGIKASEDIISQNRAVRAIHVGLGIRRSGYNIYVAGHQGTGKTSVIRNFLEKWSKDSETPKDWIYVFNFEEPQNPKAISLPTGKGHELTKTMEHLVKELKREIPQALQSEAYENAVNRCLSQQNEKQNQLFHKLETLAEKKNFQLKSSRIGIETIPIIEGKPISEKDYSKLTPSERTHIESERSKLEPQVLEFARKIRRLESEVKESVDKIQKSVVSEVLERLFKDVTQKFAFSPEVITHLGKIRNDILENALDFLHDEKSQPSSQQDDDAPPYSGEHPREKLKRYKINLFLDNKDQKGAPIILEQNPTYYNLFGKVEKNVEHGMFLTDFTLIKPGAVHKASGGYLVVEAGDIFKLPYVWEMIKRVLKTGRGFIEDAAEQFSMLPTSGLRPDPIPLDLKVIFIGSDEIYHMLLEMDDEFTKIFKIKADFDFRMPRNQTTIGSYVSFIASKCKKENLLHCHPSGVAAIVEFGSRMVEDQLKLSTRFGEIKDLTIEADYIAREVGSKLIKREHVEEAIHQKYNRVNLYEEHLLEMLEQEDIMISVHGSRIGQVNGLSVYDMGDHAFGKIGRITCTTFVNDDGIFNVERASKMSGNIHDKGVYILSGFLNALLAKNQQMAYSASVCFEQSYGMIDGDSATVAELVAIFSALAEVKVFQHFAVTGSLNQFGDVQPVGGINEKIEGFYKHCKLISQASKHSRKEKKFGVLIPYQNATNLMLSLETREAIKKGELSIFPIQYFWQAFEIMTATSFGAHDVHAKKFTEGSILEFIQKKMDKLEKLEHEKKHHESSSN